VKLLSDYLNVFDHNPPKRYRQTDDILMATLHYTHARMYVFCAVKTCMHITRTLTSSGMGTRWEQRSH